MLKKHIIIPLLLIQIINADQSDDIMQKYDLLKKQKKVQKTAQNVRLDDHMQCLLSRCAEGDCNSCKELKNIMHQILQKRKNGDAALFNAIYLNSKKIDTIFKDADLCDTEKLELVRPLQEKAHEFAEKLDELGLWNLNIQAIIYAKEWVPLRDLLILEGAYYSIEYHGYFWNGKVGEIGGATVFASESVKSACLRAPAPIFHKFIMELMHNRIKRFIAALEEIIQCDCKE